MRVIVLTPLLCIITPSAARAQRDNAPAPATRAAYLDRQGVIRWKDNDEEVAPYGANYTLPSASDYRAAGYLTQDRKKLIDETWRTSHVWRGRSRSATLAIRFRGGVHNVAVPLTPDVSRCSAWQPRCR